MNNYYSNDNYNNSTYNNTYNSNNTYSSNNAYNGNNTYNSNNAYNSNNNYNNNNTYNNNSYNNNFHNNQYNGYQSSQLDAGFESGNPIVTQFDKLKIVLAESVISKSFLFMFAALLITSLASVTTTFETAVFLLSGANFYILVAVELLIVFVSGIVINKNIPIAAGILYAIYSYLNGMTLSIIFLAYELTSITTIFLITAVLFGVMAVYGLITDSDLSSVGHLLTMGLLGIVISGIVNLLILHNSILDMIICCVGVVVFVGLAAYDTQKIKQRVEMATEENELTLALYGGFELYLDFINLFLKLLRLFGRRK